MFYLIQVVSYCFSIYSVMLLIRVLSSWIPELYRYKTVRFLFFLTDPYLNLFRRLIPPLGMIDISPIFAFIALQFIEKGFIYVMLWLYQGVYGLSRFF